MVPNNDIIAILRGIASGWGHGRSQDFFYRGGTLFQKIFQKIHYKASKNLQKIFKKIQKSFKKFLENV